MTTYSAVHVAVSLIGIGSGFVVLAGLLNGKELHHWTGLFLASTVATSVTGYGFRVDQLLPSHVVGAISLVALAVASFALYSRQLSGRWRAAYVVAAVLSLYLNVFVGIVQAFLRVPRLRAMAPSQTEPAFVLVQLLAVSLFVGLLIGALLRFRPAPASSSRRRGSRV